MFERFTEQARQVVVLAQDEALRLRHSYIGTEHLLLALLRKEGGVAARALESLDVTLDEVRAQVDRVVGRGDEPPAGQIPFTPRSKKVLELALREATALGHAYISTEHLLLGLVREGSGVAARILLDFDADRDAVRAAVLAELADGTEPRGSAAPEHEKEDDFDDEEDVVLLEFADAEDGAYESRTAIVRARQRERPVALLVAIVLAAIGFPLGVLVGFLIWG